jgi:hypothetical protein
MKAARSTTQSYARTLALRLALPGFSGPHETVSYEDATA